MYTVWCVLVKNSYYFVIFIQSGEVQKSQKVRKKDGREDGGQVGNTCPRTRTTTFPKYVVFQNFRYFLYLSEINFCLWNSPKIPRFWSCLKKQLPSPTDQFGQHTSNMGRPTTLILKSTRDFLTVCALIKWLCAGNEYVVLLYHYNPWQRQRRLLEQWWHVRTFGRSSNDREMGAQTTFRTTSTKVAFYFWWQFESRSASGRCSPRWCRY